MATGACCNAMVESILQFLSDKKRTVKTIHLLANKKQITDFVNAFVNQKMPGEQMLITEYFVQSYLCHVGF